MSEDYRCPNPKCNSINIRESEDTFECLTCGIVASKTYHCPRCKKKYLLDVYDTVWCPICEIEFDKKDFELFDDEENILTVDEKVGFIKKMRTD